jgi:PTH2 family peptidyl-tRNA hydrolase
MIIKTNMELKQVILVRKDLKLPKGKMAAQVAHASLEAALKSKKISAWRSGGAKKIVLYVESLDELLRFRKEADRMGFTTALIADAGHTTVEPGTTTCLGIGPEEERELDRLTGKLKMV